MLCPFLNADCIQAECIMWSAQHCLIVTALRRYSDTVQPTQDASALTPEAILKSCAAHYQYSSISTLRRREVEDYLAEASIPLDSSARSELRRFLKESRRAERPSGDTDGTAWRHRESNQGRIWSRDEDDDVRRLFAAGFGVSQIAKEHKRSPIAVRFCMQRLGLLPKDEQ